MEGTICDASSATDTALEHVGVLDVGKLHGMEGNHVVDGRDHNKHHRQQLLKVQQASQRYTRHTQKHNPSLTTVTLSLDLNFLFLCMFSFHTHL